MYNTDVRFFALVAVVTIYSFGWFALRRRLLEQAPTAIAGAEAPESLAEETPATITKGP